jgi:hypothetical protein
MSSTDKPMADEQAGGLPDGIELDEPDVAGPVP